MARRHPPLFSFEGARYICPDSVGIVPQSGGIIPFRFRSARPRCFAFVVSPPCPFPLPLLSSSQFPSTNPAHVLRPGVDTFRHRDNPPRTRENIPRSPPVT